MKKISSILTLVAVLVFAVSAFAADKVVVVPLGKDPYIGQQNITPSTSNQVITKGYHDGTGTVAGDVNLTPDNIKSGVSIFGVAGTFNCAAGLTDCSGQCVDTLNNPSFCGNCTTNCGESEFCSNGTCGIPSAITCSSGSDCLSGYCIEDFCRKEVKVVFITSITYTGALGGLSGADDKCQERADAANLGGTYKAWLSDDTGSPLSRFNQYDLYYILTNDIVVAGGWGDLTDGSIRAPINVDESGNSTSGSVFSNTNADGGWGSSWDYECTNWSTDSSGNANVGSSSATNIEWTWYDYVGCGFSGRLYCFEQ